MPLKLSAPLEKDIRLIDVDPTLDDDTGDPTIVTFRQATMAEHERRSALLADRTYSWTDQEVGGLVTQRTKWSMADLMKLECMLTMVGCNIHAAECKCSKCGGTEEKVVLAFPTKGGRVKDDAFQAAWARLPAKWALAIHKACLQVNVDWGGEKPEEGEA